MGASARRKQLRRSQRAILSWHGETAKLSQRLIELAQPYLNSDDGVDEYRKEMSISSAAWNLSLLPPESREKHIRSVHLPGLADEDRELIVQHFRDLVQRKEQLFPDDRRRIENVEVLDEGGTVQVLVTSTI